MVRITKKAKQITNKYNLTLLEDIPELAKSACRPGNPREVSIKQIEDLYKSLLK